MWLRRIESGTMIEIEKQAQTGSAKPNTRHTDETKFLTAKQVGGRWGWHPESVRRAMRERRIESTVIGRRRLIPISEIERIEAEGRIARAG